MYGLVAAGGACNAIFGVDGLTYDGAGGTATGAGGSGTGTGMGGAAASCAEGDTRSCYEGAPGTDGVGPCVAGVEACDGGSWSGVCEGQVVPTVESCATDVDDDCDGSNCGDLLFATTFGLAGDQIVTEVLVDADGAMIVGGTYDGDLGLDPTVDPVSNADGFVAIFDPVGVATELIQFGGGPTYTNDVALGPGGDLFVVGGYINNLSINQVDQINGANGAFDGFVARVTRAGQVVWVRQIGAGAGDTVYTVDYHPTGGLYVGGTYSSASLQVDGMDVGPGNAANFDAFVIRFDEDGSPLWAQAYGNGDVDTVEGVAAVPTGGVMLAMGVSSGANLGLPHQGNRDAAAVRLDDSGDVVWARAFGSGAEDRFEAVAHHPDGHAIAVGTISGATTFDDVDVVAAGTDAVAVAMDGASGAVLWVAPISSPGDDLATSVDVDGSGRVYVGGAHGGPIMVGDFMLPDASGRRSPFVARLLGDGSIDYAFGWLADATPIGWSNDHGHVELAAASDGTLVAGGQFVTDIDFGRRVGVIAANDASDAFLVRLAP